MLKKKAIVLDLSVETLQQVKVYFEETGVLDVIHSGDDGAIGLEKILALKPDFLIVNMFLKNVDGCEVIRKARKELSKIRILATGNAGEQIIERAISSGADYYLVKPFSMEVLKERVVELLKEETPLLSKYPTVAKRKPVTTEEKISDIFISIGIPPHIKGYNYLREGIKYMVEDPSIINNVTKELYPTIAEKYETTPSKVERAIRHAIEVAWNRGRIDAINAVFGTRIYLGNEKPTNSEFIALVADKLILENMV